MSKPDYKLKSKIIREYKNLDLYNKCKKVLYKSFYVGNVTQEEFDNAGHTLKMLEDSNPTEYKEYFRILDAKHKRVSRLRARIFDMIYKNDCLFLTFTFMDKSFARTCADFRRIAVRRYLNALGVPYVANIDFGEKKGREHYHAVVQIGRVDYSKWKYGNLNGLKIRNDIKYDDDGVITSESVEKIARYVAKLTNHAIKETTRRSVIMYSRGKTSAQQQAKEKKAVDMYKLFTDDSPCLELKEQISIDDELFS